MVEPRELAPLIDGWCELALGGFVRPSLLLVCLHEEGAVECLGPELVHHLRGVDVVGRFDRLTLAVLVDADAAGARSCADRIAEVVAGEGRGPGWIGLVSADPGVASVDLVRGAAGALDDARRYLPGTVVVGAADPRCELTRARGRSRRRTPRAGHGGPDTTGPQPPRH